MTKKMKTNETLDAALLGMAQDLRGSLLGTAVADKITMRILGDNAPAKPIPLLPRDIKHLREKAGMSQAVFASYLNLTTGYISQLERGAKQPSGAVLALLNVIRRKGIEAII